jgi:hypothetical protein
MEDVMELKIKSIELCEEGNEAVEGYDYCIVEKCQACCCHDDQDHGVCSDCEKELY